MTEVLDFEFTVLKQIIHLINQVWFLGVSVTCAILVLIISLLVKLYKTG